MLTDNQKDDLKEEAEIKYPFMEYDGSRYSSSYNARQNDLQKAFMQGSFYAAQLLIKPNQ